nr:TIR domain-containing protein [Bacilli bacterium]
VAILEILPDDFKALFFMGFYKRNQARKDYHDFLDGYKGIPLSDYDKKTVYPYLIDMMDFEDEAVVKDFLRGQGDYEACSERVSEALKRREVENELYANVTRDVFICHKSDDFDEVMPLIEAIEEDGLSCWYSERNLPRDIENYKEGIRQAIRNCRVFLVFASHRAMMSKDVQWELDVAEEEGKTQRIEYRLEPRENTTKFREFFDGLQWVDGSQYVESGLLLERIHECLKKCKDEEPEGKPQEEQGKPTTFFDKAVKSIFGSEKARDVEKEDGLINKAKKLFEAKPEKPKEKEIKEKARKAAREYEGEAAAYSGTRYPESEASLDGVQKDLPDGGMCLSDAYDKAFALEGRNVKGEASPEGVQKDLSVGGMCLFDAYDKALVLEGRNVRGARSLRKKAFKEIRRFEKVTAKERREFPFKLNPRDENQLDYAYRVLAIRDAHKDRDLGPLPTPFAKVYKTMTDLVSEAERLEARGELHAKGSKPATASKSKARIFIIVGVILLFTPVFFVGLGLLIYGIVQYNNVKD